MDIILMLLFTAAFVLSLILLITAPKKSKRWPFLFISLAVEIIVSAVLIAVFDSLPGNGMMPGFTYLGEWMVCFAALIAYIILTAVSAIVGIITLIKKKK